MPNTTKNHNKKELKDFINQNGFFCGVEINEITRDQVEEHLSENSIKTKANIPEGENVRIYKGLATQRFGKGETSRNEYKIDPNGWDWSNYLANPVILLQHDSDKVFGQAIEINTHEKGVDLLFYVDLKALDEVEAYRVAQGFIKALSTGHITHEYMWEHKKTGERLSDSEMRKRVYDDATEDKWNDFDFVVTKAEALEVSMVALPSNPKALTVQNGIELFYQNNIPTMQESEKTPTPEEKNNLKTEGETPEGQGTSSETPADPKTDSAAVQVEKKVKENKVPATEQNFLRVDQLQKALQNNELVKNLVQVICRLDEGLKAANLMIDQIPNRKKLIINNQFNESDKSVSKNSITGRLLDLMNK